jgi:hypothetical protein
VQQLRTLRPLIGRMAWMLGKRRTLGRVLGGRAHVARQLRLRRLASEGRALAQQQQQQQQHLQQHQHTC